MSDAGRRWLEASLARLGSAGVRPDPGAAGRCRRRVPEAPAMPALAGRRPAAPAEASLVALRWPEADPLSGYRGVADGTQVLARLGDRLLACSLTSEQEGPCLRGQVLARGADHVGALVHVRTEFGVVLSCVEEGGEFVAERLPSSRVLRIDLETEDGCWSLDWPAPTSP